MPSAFAAGPAAARVSTGDLCDERRRIRCRRRVRAARSEAVGDAALAGATAVDEIASDIACERGR